MSFSNKTVIITGASKGIGRALALTLAKEGANLGIAFRCVKEDQTALDTGKCREKRRV